MIYRCFFVFLFFCSCNSSDFTPAKFSPPTGKIELCNYIPKFDTIKLKHDSLLLSYDCWVCVRKDRLIILDKYTAYMHIYNLNGEYQKQKLGVGNSLKECPTRDRLTGFGINNKNEFVLVNDNIYYTYDERSHLDKVFLTNSNFNKVPENQLVGDNVEIHKWTSKRNCIRLRDSLIYTTCILGRVMPKERFNIGNNIKQININTKKAELVFARYPSIYHTDRELWSFAFASFDIDKNGSFYVCFELDSLLYKYDKDLNQVATYGFAGKNMNLDYKEYKETEEVKSVHDFMDKERNSKGYYNWIEHIDEKNILLRFYKRGDCDMNDGMQLYRNNILIADVDIPKGYRYAGYAFNEIYLYKIDILDENIYIIKTELL